MTPEKQKQKLQGHSNIAQKVFQFVPIESAWTESEISSALHRAAGSRVDPHVMRACLTQLGEAGLIRTLANGTYQRYQTSTAQVQTTKKEQPAMSKTSTTTTDTAPKAADASAIDLFAGIAKKLRDVADDIDAAALIIEEGQVQAEQKAAKFRQLQALLKEAV